MRTKAIVNQIQAANAGQRSPLKSPLKIASTVSPSWIHAPGYGSPPDDAIGIGCRLERANGALVCLGSFGRPDEICLCGAAVQELDNNMFASDFFSVFNKAARTPRISSCNEVSITGTNLLCITVSREQSWTNRFGLCNWKVVASVW